MLIVKNGRLVAERYFNGSSAEVPVKVQSVTKSVTSALVGISLERRCLSSLDQKLFEFFPEQAARIQDPRKREADPAKDRRDAARGRVTRRFG